jgi:hypothetical protein
MKKILMTLATVIGTAGWITAATVITHSDVDSSGNERKEQPGFRVYWPHSERFAVVKDSVVVLSGGIVQYHVAVEGVKRHMVVTQKASSNPTTVGYSFGDIPGDWTVRTISLESGDTGIISVPPSNSLVHLLFERRGTVTNIFYADADSVDLIVALAEQLR